MSAGGRVRRTVLVADDDDDLRCALADALRDADDLDVLEARDGAEALAIALSEHPDVLVLDHRMPGLSGAEVVERLRQAGVDVPVVLVTAARDIDRLAARLGLACFLGKPFTVEDLLVQIRRALAGGC